MSESFKKKGVHQYTRAFGSEQLVEQVAKMYSPHMGRELNPLTEVVITAGGVNALCAAFAGTLNAGDEVILIEPFYDCYLPQIELAGAKAVGVPLRPSTPLAKAELGPASASSPWELDLPAISGAITERTKFIVLNNPHNPTGKVFEEHEFRALAELLRLHPRVNVISDEVYEHISFRQPPFQIHRMQQQPDMFARCLSICSAGKLFSATGVRIGWAIGPERLVKPMMTFNQYNTFCLCAPIQAAIRSSLQTALAGSFFQDQCARFQALRDVLVAQLKLCKYDWRLWVPDGGYFVLADITDCPVDQKFMVDA